MKTILCYGDSNTYGYIPGTGQHYPKNLRWTTILANKLGDNYDVIPEGLNGRTTAFDLDGDNMKNGLAHYRTIFSSHRPIDLVIFMLGTNDVTTNYNLSLEEITKGMEDLIATNKEISLEKQDYVPEVILICPAAIKPNYHSTPLEYQLNDEVIEKSQNLHLLYEQLANKYRCHYLDCTNKLEVSELDCMHLTALGHLQLADILYEIISTLNLNK